MVTLDNVVVSVSEFNGDIVRGRKDFQRSVQGLELIEEHGGAFLEALKAETGFHSLNPPEEATSTQVDVGDVSFIVVSHMQHKPGYKSALEYFETDIIQAYNEIRQSLPVDGVVKIGNHAFMDVETLVAKYDGIVKMVMNPGIHHKVTFSLEGALASEEVQKELQLQTVAKSGKLAPEAAANYVRMQGMKKGLADFKKAYGERLKMEVGLYEMFATGEMGESQYERLKQKLADGKLTKKQYGAIEIEEEAKAPVGKTKAAQVTKTRVSSKAYGQIVQTLLTVDTNPDAEGELNLLADSDTPKAEKEREMPEYNLRTETIGGERRLLVRLDSVYMRIQDLKKDHAIEYDRHAIKSLDIV